MQYANVYLEIVRHYRYSGSYQIIKLKFSLALNCFQKFLDDIYILVLAISIKLQQT